MIIAKKILITSGPVYGHLDDNKIFSNMAKGKWALRFADFLKEKGHLVVSLHNMEWKAYQEACIQAAKTVDAAVMAAAVVNYVPEKTFDGKMPTDLDEVSVKLVRTPYIIDEIRRVNPKCKLIGCKLTSREGSKSTIIKAQQLMDRSRAHAVIANDKSDLKLKMLCFPDGAVLRFDSDFDSLYSHLEAMINDVHFHTMVAEPVEPDRNAHSFMKKLLARYAWMFERKWAGKSKLFGSIAVRHEGNLMLTTPRVKKPGLSVEECPAVSVSDDFVVTHGGKATMNAPLLWYTLWNHPEAAGVVHVHEFLGGVESVPYAPAGTFRDSFRKNYPTKFNIDGHGFVACVDKDGNLI
jgi:hypothetical protein